jgi:hypothetical protein
MAAPVRKILDQLMYVISYGLCLGGYRVCIQYSIALYLPLRHIVMYPILDIVICRHSSLSIYGSQPTQIQGRPTSPHLRDLALTTPPCTLYTPYTRMYN